VFFFLKVAAKQPFFIDLSSLKGFHTFAKRLNVEKYQMLPERNLCNPEKTKFKKQTLISDEKITYHVLRPGFVFLQQ